MDLNSAEIERIEGERVKLKVIWSYVTDWLADTVIILDIQGAFEIVLGLLERVREGGRQILTRGQCHHLQALVKYHDRFVKDIKQARKECRKDQDEQGPTCFEMALATCEKYLRFFSNVVGRSCRPKKKDIGADLE